MKRWINETNLYQNSFILIKNKLIIDTILVFCMLWRMKTNDIIWGFNAMAWDSYFMLCHSIDINMIWGML